MNGPDKLTKLPDSGAFTLKSDTRVDGSDLQRFVAAGGAIVPGGYRLFIDGPATISPTMFEKTPQGQTTTIFGSSLTVPPGTAITGAYLDGNGGSGTCVQILPSTSLRADTLVYRVAEVDPPPDKRGPHTWKAACIVVERASDRRIKLKTPLPGHGGTVFKPDALGRLFFETPLQAIQFFMAARRLEIEALDRRRKEAERAIAWASSQEGVSP